MDATLQDPLVGQLLDGRYRVDSRVARGGMATVYRALDTRLDRPVALKVMHPGLAADEEFVARFIREAKSAARLSHPNVVAVFDQGTDGETVFLAMEYVEGRTLRDLLRERGRLPAREALAVLEPVLAALGAAHQAGIVHRDVKPENVLLATDGRVKVADFGLARAVSSSTTTASTHGLLIGTVAYLAPEQVAHGRSDARSDVYAAGIVLFELLTGSKPFDGDSPIQVAYRHVHEDVPLPSTRVTGLPAAVDVLVRRACAREPGGRPADANEFLAGVVAARRVLGSAPAGGAAPDLGKTLVVPLERVEPAPAGTVPAAAETTERTGRSRSPRRRRRWLRVVTLLALLGLLAGGGGWWYAVAGPGAYTPAPGLLNLTSADAEAKATALGFTVDYGEAQFSETVGADRVIASDPDPGDRVRKNSTIELVLSRGKERYEVPRLAGVPEKQALAALKRNRLAAGTVDRTFSDTVPKGRVISVTPEAGTPLKKGETVALVVSRGVEPVEVPSVAGQPAPAARDALEARGFKVNVTEEFSETVAEGVVISQDPASGTRPKGSTVTLLVSKGMPLVTVPDVVGQTVAQARAALEALGIRVRVIDLPAGPNRVLDQSPDGGDQVRKGSQVSLSSF